MNLQERSSSYFVSYLSLMLVILSVIVATSWSSPSENEVIDNVKSEQDVLELLTDAEVTLAESSRVFSKIELNLFKSDSKLDVDTWDSLIFPLLNHDLTLDLDLKFPKYQMGNEGLIIEQLLQIEERARAHQQEQSGTVREIRVVLEFRHDLATPLSEAIYLTGISRYGE